MVGLHKLNLKSIEIRLSYFLGPGLACIKTDWLMLQFPSANTEMLQESFIYAAEQTNI